MCDVMLACNVDTGWFLWGGTAMPHMGNLQHMLVCADGICKCNVQAAGRVTTGRTEPG